jgi:hypothetical protein
MNTAHPHLLLNYFLLLDSIFSRSFLVPLLGVIHAPRAPRPHTHLQ